MIQAVRMENSNIIEITQVKKSYKKKKNLVAQITETTERHAADPLRDKERINTLLLELLCNGDICKATTLIFGFNTGYRAGDIFSLRVKDLFDGESPKQYISMVEDKTEKVRKVWLNEAIRKMLTFTRKTKNLSSEDYMFIGDGNKRTYVKEHLYNLDGSYKDTVTTFEKFDENGNERIRAAMCVGSFTKFLKCKAEMLNIEEHLSSHAMRKTYAYFLAQNWEENSFIQAVCQDFGHSSSRVTIEHYMQVDPLLLKEKQLSLNIGLEVIEEFVKDYEERR